MFNLSALSLVHVQHWLQGTQFEFKKFVPLKTMLIYLYTRGE